MLILRPYEPKVLMPVPASDWRAPSRAQPKDQFGRESRTLFRIRARLHDGHSRWTGWFEDRDDFDAFLWAIVLWREEGIPIPRPLWELPQPAWHPSLDEGVRYDFASLVFLTGSAGSNQTWTRPVDFAAAANSIELLGAGAAGAIAQSTNYSGTGGGSGVYSKIVNFAAGATETYQVGAQGACAAITTTGTLTSTGTDGGDTWFGDATFASADVNAKGGQHGNAATTAVTANGGVGGLASASTGITKRDGSRGGNITGVPLLRNATGGGGAPGPSAAGSDGGDLASPAGTGSAGGASGDGAAGAPANTTGVGANGTGWQVFPPEGAGGGGCGYRFTAGETGIGSTAGNYGAGGGGAGKNGWSAGSAKAGDGGQGIIVVTYTPLISTTGAFFTLLGV